MEHSQANFTSMSAKNVVRVFVAVVEAAGAPVAPQRRNETQGIAVVNY